jgi:hypothetical protein
VALVEGTDGGAGVVEAGVVEAGVVEAGVVEAGVVVGAVAADEEVAVLDSANGVGGMSLAGGRVDEAETGVVDGTICGDGSGTLRGTWGRYTTWVAATRPSLLA